MTASKETRPGLSMGDIIEVSYTARLAESNRVIDTTDPDVAAEADIADLTADGPVMIVLGAEHLFDPVERAIIETGVGGSDTVAVPASEAFGAPDPAATATVDIDHFPADNRAVGDRVDYKGQTGFIESVEDGTARVNFNHPLAGTSLTYTFNVHRRVEDPLEQARGLVELHGLTDETTVTRDDQSTLTLTIAAPERIADYATKKRDAVKVLHEHVPVEEVRVIERYPGGG